MTRASLTFPTAMFLLLCASGCEVHSHGYYDDYDDHYDDHYYDGALTIDWSLDDSFDPDVCDHYDAYSAELIVYEDGDDDEVVHLERRCDDFETTIDLPDGVYSLDATLLDHSDRPVTTTLALDDVDVYAGEETRISLDFPLDSRL